MDGLKCFGLQHDDRVNHDTNKTIETDYNVLERSKLWFRFALLFISFVHIFPLSLARAPDSLPDDAVINGGNDYTV